MSNEPELQGRPAPSSVHAAAPGDPWRDAGHLEAAEAARGDDTTEAAERELAEVWRYLSLH